MKSALQKDPRIPRTAARVAAAWGFAAVADLVHADLLVLLAVIGLTAALSRYGSTLLDRVMAAVVVLAAAGIAGGLVVSFWPWGLDPPALGGTALSLLMILSAVTGREFRLPRRFPAADVVAVAAGVAALFVAAWPTLHTGHWKRLSYSALLADRIRQYAMFDMVRTGQSYPFAHYDRVSANALPGAKSHPSGMQMVYAMLDSFTHSSAQPGAPLDEFNRYYWYTLVAFALLVTATAWAARRLAAPLVSSTHRLPAVFVTAGIGAFLASGYYLSYVWQGFDSVVFASTFLVLGMAVILRPPRSTVEHAVLAGSAFLAVVYGHPLLFPHIALTLLAGLVLHRKRFFRNDRVGIAVLAAAGAVLVGIPLLAVSGLNIAKRFQTDGFIIPQPRHQVITIAVLALLALAGPTARRRPACRAAFAAVAAVGLLQLVMEANFLGHGATHYYVEKSLNGFVLMCLVGTGSLATLWRSPAGAGAAARNWAARQAEAVIAASVAVLAVGAIAFSPSFLDWQRYQPGTDSTWAQIWTGGRTFIAAYGHQIQAQERAGVYRDHKPTIVAASDAGVLNLNMSLLAGALDRNLSSVNKQVNRAAEFTGLVGLPAHGTLSPTAQNSLKALEHVLSSNPVPLRVVVSDQGLATRLREWGAANPTVRFEILYIP